jgi:hypothetical protein
MQIDLVNIIKSPASPAQLTEARGLLVPFLRDGLVGLNYAYYEPPGAQMLHNNPLFVRSHDFSGEMTRGGEQAWQTPRLFGRGYTASGGAHLAGSLADLPYVLAQVEQDFIVPENVQSLIWEDLVPGLVTSAVLPRWWRVTRNELHAVALYQRFGEDLIAASAANEKMRERVMNILSARMLPQTFEQVEQAIRKGQRDEELIHLPPHPALAQTYGRELLNVKPFPTFLGYSSRLLAESWDSNNLYWARLADEMGYPPVMLHHLVPELTHRMVEKIFASHLEEWPALLLALRKTGEEFRKVKIATAQKT